VVCTQSTKRLAFTLGASRKGVADFHLTVSDNNTINQQLEKSPLAVEVGTSQSIANTPAELLRIIRQAGCLMPIACVSKELLFLPLQSRQAALRLPATPLKLG
jgi:hypothetical protein